MDFVGISVDVFRILVYFHIIPMYYFRIVVASAGIALDFLHILVDFPIIPVVSVFFFIIEIGIVRGGTTSKICTLIS